MRPDLSRPATGRRLSTCDHKQCQKTLATARMFSFHRQTAQIGQRLAPFRQIRSNHRFPLSFDMEVGPILLSHLAHQNARLLVSLGKYIKLVQSIEILPNSLPGRGQTSKTSRMMACRRKNLTGPDCGERLPRRIFDSFQQTESSFHLSALFLSRVSTDPAYRIRCDCPGLLIFSVDTAMKGNYNIECILVLPTWKAGKKWH